MKFDINSVFCRLTLHVQHFFCLYSPLKSHNWNIRGVLEDGNFLSNHNVSDFPHTLSLSLLETILTPSVFVLNMLPVEKWKSTYPSLIFFSSRSLSLSRFLESQTGVFKLSPHNIPLTCNEVTTGAKWLFSQPTGLRLKQRAVFSVQTSN